MQIFFRLFGYTFFFFFYTFSPTLEARKTAVVWEATAAHPWGLWLRLGEPRGDVVARSDCVGRA